MLVALRVLAVELRLGRTHCVVAKERCLLRPILAVWPAVSCQRQRRQLAGFWGMLLRLILVVAVSAARG